MISTLLSITYYFERIFLYENKLIRPIEICFVLKIIILLKIRICL